MVNRAPIPRERGPSIPRMFWNPTCAKMVQNRATKYDMITRGGGVCLKRTVLHSVRQSLDHYHSESVDSRFMQIRMTGYYVVVFVIVIHGNMYLR